MVAKESLTVVTWLNTTMNKVKYLDLWNNCFFILFERNVWKIVSFVNCIVKWLLSFTVYVLVKSQSGFKLVWYLFLWYVPNTLPESLRKCNGNQIILNSF